jgi:hypothetical protein
MKGMATSCTVINVPSAFQGTYVFYQGAYPWRAAAAGGGAPSVGSSDTVASNSTVIPGDGSACWTVDSDVGCQLFPAGTEVRFLSPSAMTVAYATVLLGVAQSAGPTPSTSMTFSMKTLVGSEWVSAPCAVPSTPFVGSPWSVAVVGGNVQVSYSGKGARDDSQVVAVTVKLASAALNVAVSIHESAVVNVGVQAVAFGITSAPPTSPPVFTTLRLRSATAARASVNYTRLYAGATITSGILARDVSAEMAGTSSVEGGWKLNTVPLTRFISSATFAGTAYKAVGAATVLLHVASDAARELLGPFRITLQTSAGSFLATTYFGGGSSGAWTCRQITNNTFIDVLVDNSAAAGDPASLTMVFSQPLNQVQVQGADVVGTTTGIGMQVVAFSTSMDPPPACFGAQTLLLCEDGVRRRCSDLGATAVVMAMDPVDGATLCPVPVAVYQGANTKAVTCPVAEGVWLTGEHVVSIMHRPNADPMPARTVSVGGPFAGCTWFTRQLPEYATCTHIEFALYHLGPLDFERYRDYAVVVGVDNTIVAELYRSPASRLVASHHFWPVKD